MRPSPRESILSWQRFLHVGQGVSHDGHGCGVFAEFGGNYFIERVGGRVVIVEILAAILHQAEGGNSGIGDGGDVRAWRLGTGLEDSCAYALQDGLNRA
jgi:hypothetical protein